MGHFCPRAEPADRDPALGERRRTDHRSEVTAQPDLAFDRKILSKGLITSLSRPASTPVNSSMTMIDYFLLAGFAAASGYTIHRLFVGFRNSSAAQLRMDGTEEGKQGADVGASR